MGRSFRVRCRHNKNASLPNGLWPDGSFPQTVYDLRIEQEYEVYAICLVHRILQFLIDTSEVGKPHWYPSGLFEDIAADLPESWSFGSFPSRAARGVIAIWGYPTLVRNADHFDGLADLDTNHCITFVREAKMWAKEDQ